MTTLTLCIGIFLGGCVQVRTFDFADREACERERQQQLATLRGGWAVCALKSKATP